MKDKGEKNLENLTLEEIDRLITTLDEQMKEYEEVLTKNVEWPSGKQKDELMLTIIKKKEGREKKVGWLYNLLFSFGRNSKQNIENRLKKNYYPPRKLKKDDHKFLEEEIKKTKDKIVFLSKCKKYKEERDKT